MSVLVWFGITEIVLFSSWCCDGSFPGLVTKGTNNHRVHCHHEVIQGVDVMVEGDEFECPDCGSSFSYGTVSCPGCGVEIDWDPSEELETEEVEVEGLTLVDPRLPPEEPLDEVPDKLFSRFGLVWAVITVLAFSGTVLLLNWDTWIRGEAESSIGDTQRMMIYAGAIVTTVFAFLTIYDLLKGGVLPQDANEQRV
jgi:hypothetical protein